jgi:hypothetical protein
MTRPDFPKFAFPTAALHCGVEGLSLISSVAGKLVLEYARVGPNSEEIVRVRPFPSCKEFCLVSGDVDKRPLDSLEAPCAIVSESALAWARRVSSIDVASRPLEDLKSWEVETERVILFIALKGIGERVLRGASIRGRVSWAAPSRPLFSLSRFNDQPCHRLRCVVISALCGNGAGGAGLSLVLVLLSQNEENHASYRRYHYVSICPVGLVNLSSLMSGPSISVVSTSLGPSSDLGTIGSWKRVGVDYEG